MLKSFDRNNPNLNSLILINLNVYELYLVNLALILT